MPRLLVMADGRAVHTERWCRYFEATGFETALFSLEPCTITPPRQLFPGKRPSGVGMVDYFLARKRLQAVVAEFRPDIINPHYIISYAWLAWLARLKPVVATAWGSDLLLMPHRSFLHRQRIRRALHWADWCTVDNQNLFEATARFSAPGKIIRVVMGVERRLFDRMAKIDFPQSGPLRIVAPRGLGRVYDPFTIVEACRLIGKRIDYHLDLFGSGRDLTLLQEAFRKRSLGGRISLLPFRPHEEFALSLKEYDVYLAASRSDSTSVALLEAMASGLYPVVTDIPGNREWVRSGENGRLFKVGAPLALAEALDAAARQRAEFGRIAAANRERIAGEAIWEENMDRLRDLMLTMVR
ncbi:MAG: glycosyltransferase family 4 protein [candidate division Zixibacteria bacterium]|nr:glycosyltransferase family 4 protein [candidate division Zixibacteria bacterium]